MNRPFLRHLSTVPLLFAGILSLTACGITSHPTPIPPTATPYVLVLGTAQDGGLPQIGCRQPCCTAARDNPSLQRHVASLLIVDPSSGQRWLIDATPDLPDQVERMEGHPPARQITAHRPPLVDGIFLTHAHMGHYTGLLHLGTEAYAATGLPVFASSSMADFLATNRPWSRMVEMGQITLFPLSPGRPHTLTKNPETKKADLMITPIPVPHRAEFTDTVGYIIRGPSRSLLYIPDIDKWDQGHPIEDMIADVDIALLDGTFYGEGEIPGRSMADIPHPFILESIERFAQLPDSERAKIRFTHLNHSNPAAAPDSPQAREVHQTGMIIAEDGQIITL